MVVELRPKERRNSLRHPVGATKLMVLFLLKLQLSHPLRLDASHARSDTVVDVSLVDPHPQGLDPKPEPGRDPLHGPLRDTKLGAQHPHPPHRRRLLL